MEFVEIKLVRGTLLLSYSASFELLVRKQEPHRKLSFLIRLPVT